MAQSQSMGFVTSTQRLTRAVQNLQGYNRPLATVEEIFNEIKRERPPAAPATHFKHCGGTGRPIALPFSATSTTPIPQLQQLSLMQSVNKQNLLIQLTVSGKPGEIFQLYKDTIILLLSQFKIQIVDTF